jgi:hypothetical protein
VWGAECRTVPSQSRAVGPHSEPGGRGASGSGALGDQGGAALSPLLLGVAAGLVFGVISVRQMHADAAAERLGPTLGSAAVSAAVLLPFVAIGNVAGNELTHIAAAVLLGGLATSTFVNLLILPAVHLRLRSPSPNSTSRTGPWRRSHPEETPMLHARSSLAAAVALGALLSTACGGSSSPVVAPSATLVGARGGSAGRILLTPVGAQRIGVQTATVRRVPLAAAPARATVVVPSGALIYDASGRTYVFVGPAALSYTEVPVSVAYVSSGSA